MEYSEFESEVSYALENHRQAPELSDREKRIVWTMLHDDYYIYEVASVIHHLRHVANY